MPAENSAIDLMVRARAKGEPVSTHHMVANSYSILLAGAGWRRRAPDKMQGATREALLRQRRHLACTLLACGVGPPLL